MNTQIQKTSLVMLVIFGGMFVTAATAQTSLQTKILAKAQPADASTQKKIDELIAQLGSKNNSDHSSAHKSLVKIGQPAIQPLIRALKNTNPAIRLRLARVLMKIGDHKTVLPLTSVLLDEDRSVSKAAANALVHVLGRHICLFMPMFMIVAIFGMATIKLFKKMSIKTLTIVFVSASLVGLAPFFLPKSICTGIGFFIFLGGFTIVAVKIIGEIYYEDDLYDLKTGENPFSEIGEVQTIKSLIKDLRDKDPRVSKAAQKALIPPLITKLDDEDPPIRAAAARALGRIGGKQCIKSLSKALDDEDLCVHEAAKEGLMLNIIKAFNDKEPQNRAAAARALGKIGSRRGVKPLRNVLTDEYPCVRAAAARALGQVGSKRGIKPLAKTLRDRDQTVRDAAKEGLALIKKKLSPEEWEKIVRKRA